MDGSRQRLCLSVTVSGLRYPRNAQVEARHSFHLFISHSRHSVSIPEEKLIQALLFDMADNPPSTHYIGTRLTIFLAFFTPLQIVLVALRLVARRLTVRSRGYDDFLVIACLLSQLVATGLAIGQ